MVTMKLGVAYKDEGGTNPVGSTTTRECTPEDDSDDDEFELLFSVEFLTPYWSLGHSMSVLSRPEQL